MLQIKTIHAATFALLKNLSSMNELQPFALAGGTALALQLGHRISIDLDFITDQKFDSIALFERLSESFEIEKCATAPNSLSFFVNRQESSIKIDFIRHNYQTLQPIVNTADIRFFSLADIAAMKLNAVANRGAKKDFYDIHALLSRFSLCELLGFFEKKYSQMNSFTVIKSLVYFNDADLEPNPMSLTDITWDQVKKDLQQIVLSTT